MPHTTRPPAASHLESIWDKVLPLLDPQYLRQAPPEKLEHFRNLVIGAAYGGNDAEGPVREVLSLLGDRWSTLLLQLAHYGPLRFSTLQRIIGVLQAEGISRRMLSLKLRALERDGLVSRRVIPTVPPRVEYSLTALGEELWQIAALLVDWLEDHSEQIKSARRHFEQHEDASPASDAEE